jgi:hypothetical protein
MPYRVKREVSHAPSLPDTQQGCFDKDWYYERFPQNSHPLTVRLWQMLHPARHQCTRVTMSMLLLA